MNIQTLEANMLNVFYKDNKEYTQSLNPAKFYLNQLSTYIQVDRSVSKEEANKLALEIYNSNFKDKQVKFFHRKDNGDKVVDHTTLLSYIDGNIKNKNIVVPTLTVYKSATEQKSLLSEFIAENVKRRSLAKKISQKAKADGDNELSESKNNEQNMMKIYNNSLSGAFAQESCILHNPTAHSTLTSITRTITSLANSNNEKLIAGNRYLPRGIDVLNEIVYLVTYMDIEKIKFAIDTYSLKLLSVEDVVNSYKRSTDLYFKDEKYYNEVLIPFLSKLDPYTLSGIVYTGDLYHIRVFNEDFTRELIRKITLPIDSDISSQNTPELIYAIDENILNFVHHILYSKVKGYGKDYNKMNQDNIASSVLQTAYNVESLILEYRIFFDSFFNNDILPVNSFRLENMMRRVVVLSDTDSTCFTTDEWVRWYKKEFIINDETIGLAGFLSYISSQTIKNQLKIVSNYLNIDKENLEVLGMKNEYLWTVHAPCEVSKHYFAYTAIQEGNVFKDLDKEIKGVHLKNSAVPKFIIEDSKEIMEYILSSIHNNNKVKLHYILERIIKLEEKIREGVLKGESLYFKKSKIKNNSAYALAEDKSPYSRHLFWKDVFSPKYGDIQETPYDVIKIPTIVINPTALREWLEAIEDKVFSDRLSSWLQANNKKELPTIFINDTYVQGNGIPVEVKQVIDINKIVIEITMQHRVILETLGLLLYKDKLISEQFCLN